MPTNKAVPAAVLVAAAALLLGTLAFLYSRTEAIDFKRDAQVLSLLRELRDLDARWDADASRLAAAPPGAPAPADRSGPLARILRELENAATARPEVSSSLGAIKQGMNDKAAAWSALRERHAKAAEALAAASTAATALSGEAANLRLRDPRHAEKFTVVAGEAGQLVAAARLLDPDAPPTPLFETRLVTLKEAANAADPSLAALGAKAEASLRDYLAARAEARKAEQKFSFLTAGSRVEQLAQSLSRNIETSLEDKERWRVYLFFYAAALLIGVGYLASRVVAAQAALKAANESLEKRVKERTRELSETLVRLKDSESQLVQSEKMSSLGQMVAGVAHEINTPLAYVKNSVATVRDRLPELEDSVRQSERLLALLQSDAPDAKALQESFANTSARLAQLKEHQVLGDLHALTKDGLHGIDQISDLVSNLKNFSRLDRSKIASFNVNEGIVSTLLIAKTELRGVEIERRFGEIPSITCSPSQVNQIFLNLVTNAVQAMDRPDKAIVITTRREGTDAIAVEVADNGKGIAPDVLPRIFDPFFTTKEVGKGTGLGLSIVYKIVEQHGGKIDVKSTVGQGTVFTVVLPVNPPAEFAAS